MHDGKKSSYSYDELILCGKGKLFGSGNAQLPLPPMLMFDAIDKVEISGGKYGKGVVVAHLTIREDMWFFGCHFLNDSVMPGCLGLDALWQMVGFFLCWSGYDGRGRALGVGEVKFTGMVTPASKNVEYKLDIRRVLKRGLVLGIADGTLAVDGVLVYTAKDLKVGLFQDLDVFSNVPHAPSSPTSKGVT